MGRRQLPAAFPGLPTAPRRRDEVERDDRILARYDAADIASEDAAHWARVDYLSPTAALSPAVRRLIVAKARHEAANNANVRGMIETFTNWVIGTGPRLQMQTASAEANKRIEAAFAEWFRAAKIPQKLRLMCRAGYVVDGEALALAINNPRLPTDCKLDLRVVEAEQLESPASALGDPEVIDGVRLDAAGEPTIYYLHPRHPGDLLQISPIEPQPVDARYVAHWFRRERPGQVRGVSQLAAALKSIADLRRYSAAVIGAAETAANVAAALESQAPPADDDTPTAGAPFEEIDLPRRGMVVIPYGHKLNQMKAEQPTQSYESFRGAVLTEQGRSMFLPSNLGRGDSSDYNFASGQLDHMDFWRTVRIVEQEIDAYILDWLLGLWLDEAVVAMPGLLDGIGAAAVYPHRWLWNNYQSINPVDAASAFKTAWEIGAATLNDWWGERGHDPEEKLAEWKRERAVVASAAQVAVAGSPAPNRPADENPSPPNPTPDDETLEKTA